MTDDGKRKWNNRTLKFRVSHTSSKKVCLTLFLVHLESQPNNSVRRKKCTWYRYIIYLPFDSTLEINSIISQHLKPADFLGLS